MNSCVGFSAVSALAPIAQKIPTISTQPPMTSSGQRIAIRIALLIACPCAVLARVPTGGAL